MFISILVTALNIRDRIRNALQANAARCKANCLAGTVDMDSTDIDLLMTLLDI